MRNISSRAWPSEINRRKRRRGFATGVSSNGRTAVSGTVCEGSTPSTPAILVDSLMAPSSSGLGRRPLKAKVAGSNPVGATKLYPGHVFRGLFNGSVV